MTNHILRATIDLLAQVLAQYLHPPQNTVRQPIAEVGKRVVDMLLRIIRGGAAERKMSLPPKLIVRGSSGGDVTR